MFSLCFLNANGQVKKVDPNISVIVQHQLYPNPLLQGNNCKLDIVLTQESSVSVKVFDIIGNKVFEIDKYYHKGSHDILLETSSLQKGVYFVNILDGYKKHVKRLMVR